MPFLLGAYAAAPTDPTSADFAEFFAGLAGRDAVGGLELPSHHLNDAAAAAAITAAGPDSWENAVTCFPGTMLSMAQDPAVGLASSDDAGRQAAVGFVAELREAIARFNDRPGGGTIRHLFLHSAPRGGSADALAVSLDEISGWDWGSDSSRVHLQLEHCDAPAAGFDPQKGFLTLTDELAVGERYGVGLVVNWGRSAIETRSVDGPVQHLTSAREAGRLSGLMFSGAAEVDGEFGAAWLDAHLPSSTVTGESLMTPEQMSRCLAAAGTAVDARLVGAKVGVRPVEATVAQRLSVIDRVLADVGSAAAAG